MSHSLLHSPEFFNGDAARTQALYGRGARPSDLRSDAGTESAARRKGRNSAGITAATKRDERDGARPPASALRYPTDGSHL